MSNLEVIKAKYLQEYKLKVWFNNGQIRLVDLEDHLQGEVFEPLKDIEQFKDFTINFNTIEWKNGADFAPEYLYEVSFETKLTIAEERQEKYEKKN